MPFILSVQAGSDRNCEYKFPKLDLPGMAFGRLKKLMRLVITVLPLIIEVTSGQHHRREGFDQHHMFDTAILKL